MKQRMKPRNLMKPKNLLITTMIALPVLTSFVSCREEMEMPYGYTDGAIVTVKPNADNSGFIMQLNDSTELYARNLASSPWANKEVRALLQYKVTDREHQNYVWVQHLDSIYTCPLQPDLGERNDATYGTDPIEIVPNCRETCIGDGYLSFRYTYQGEKAPEAHQLALVHIGDSADFHLLELFHNAQGDTLQTADLPKEGLIAFRLDRELTTSTLSPRLILHYRSPKAHTRLKFE